MDIRLDLAALATELADPHQHREPRWGWTGTRNKTRLKDHVTVQAGLLIQLRGEILPALTMLDEGARGVPRSMPPLQVEALDAYLDIDVHVKTWCSALGLRARPTPEECVRALVGAHLGDRAEDLLGDMRRWRNTAATMTGWVSMFRPRATCPVVDCQEKDTLRVNLAAGTAVCVACRSWWDEGSIGVLAQHIASRETHQRVRIGSGMVGSGGRAGG